MKRRGFTLVELLAVITILGILAVIVVPTVDRQIKKFKNDSYQQQVTMIELVAKNWGVDHRLELPTVEGELYYLKLEDLVTQGFLKDEDIIDPRNNQQMNGCILVNYDAAKDNYDYQYQETPCDSLKN